MEFMQLDIKKALLSPFSDNKWKGKIFILTLLSVFAGLLDDSRMGWLSWFPTFIFNGYCAQFIYNEMKIAETCLSFY